MDEKEKQPEQDNSHSDEQPKKIEDIKETSAKKPLSQELKDDTKEQSSDKSEDNKIDSEKADLSKTEAVETPKKKMKPGKDKHKKEGKEQESIKKKDIKRDENFRYIVRIANTDLDGNKTIEYGLTQIKGIGHRMSNFILNVTGIDRFVEVGNLTDEQIEKIRVALENISKSAPAWMLNHQRDFDSGENIHLVSTDVAMKLRDDINLMKMIRCYRGIRHEQGLPVRGQRTKANGRIGLAMGVSKRIQTQQASSTAKKEK